LQSGALVFCVENQEVLYWGVRHASLDEDNPPVHFAFSEDVGEDLAWEMSHERLSDFLDALTYAHAFAGGAVHGGASHEEADEQRVALLRRHWREVEIRSVRWGLVSNSGERRWPLYVRKGQAIDWLQDFSVAARTVEDVDWIDRTLVLTWRKRW
jgi:hypothetical protein